MFTKSKIIFTLKQYLSTVLLTWLAILIYRYNPYYAGFLMPQTQAILLYFAIAYTVLGFFYYWIIPRSVQLQSKGHILLIGFKRFFSEIFLYLKTFTQKPAHPLPKLEKHEKTALLFLLVKLFFLPIMLNFLVGNYFAAKDYYNFFQGFDWTFSIQTFNNVFFPAIISLVFLIDVLYFSFGYMFEARFLKNTIRSVEPTVFGWAVALICYPPFNGFFSNYVSWYANDMAYFFNDTVTFAVRIIIVLLFFVYVGASIALGTRCSNLTNRGIITKGPYAVVRHPAYIAKNLAWIITIIPIFSFAAFLSVLAWAVIYYFRAITEERHLIKDPDYQAYCKKVRYRFIPGIW